MKMHSYITVNGQLQNVTEQSDRLFAKLKKATESVGGWDQAIAVARAKQDELEAQSSQDETSSNNGRANSTHEPTPIGTPPIPEGSTTSFVDVKTASALKKRLNAVVNQSKLRDELVNGQDVGLNTVQKTEIRTESKGSGSAEKTTTYVVEAGRLPDGPAPHPLVYHPDPSISAMAKDYSELQAELISSGPMHAKWPETITWKNFVIYQLIPTLVYELEYPRTDRSVLSRLVNSFLVTDKPFVEYDLCTFSRKLFVNFNFWSS